MEAGLIDSHDIRKILFQSELMWHPKMPYIVEGLLWRELSRRLDVYKRQVALQDRR